MPFAPFTPPEPQPRVIETTARSVPTRSLMIGTGIRARRVMPVRKPTPRWVWWLVSLAAFVTLWWVSLDFRGLVILLGIFWFFAIGVHPVVHMGRTVHDIFDGED